MTGSQGVRWGILGTGWIATKFAADLARAPGARLVAVGSRSQAGAERFGARFDIPRRHGRYEALAADPEVEVVYIASPHPFHREHAILCLEAGKHVLCEKPFTLNAREAVEVVAAARRAGRFLMEAMWVRFFPLMGRLRELIAAGTIGELRMLMADFGFRADWQPEHRLFNPALGGGALLDVGIYPLSLASFLLGEPEEMVSLAHLGESGVDEQNGILLRHPGGALALLSSALRTTTPTEAQLLGTAGRIKLHHPWYRPTRLTLARPGQPDELVVMPVEGEGFQFEALEVMRCLAAGKLESETMPLAESVALMERMDRLRAGWPLRYPGE